MDKVKPVRMKTKKYKGFLHVKCPFCGRIRSFCKRVPGSRIRCKCGKSFELKHMVPVWVKCECNGPAYRYLTNRNESMFDIECLSCGAPVCVEWNRKKRVYTRVEN